ncbi:vegetative cell wall protein gp1-like [Lutra lutra]|uniref:vegetative cell wall protein gp1-like n=1 Tax=Lutra lutra TaxID=9657 RepID=UPI001FD4EE13|nr:vegetative cell wall protein gp1-like [Lutra lutra]
MAQPCTPGYREGLWQPRRHSNSGSGATGGRQQDQKGRAISRWPHGKDRPERPPPCDSEANPALTVNTSPAVSVPGPGTLLPGPLWARVLQSMIPGSSAGEELRPKDRRRANLGEGRRAATGGRPAWGDRRAPASPRPPPPATPNPPADAAPHEPEAGLADFAAPRSPARTASGGCHRLSVRTEPLPGPRPPHDPVLSFAGRGCGHPGPRRRAAAGPRPARLSCNTRRLHPARPAFPPHGRAAVRPARAPDGLRPAPRPRRSAPLLPTPHPACRPEPPLRLSAESSPSARGPSASGPLTPDTALSVRAAARSRPPGPQEAAGPGLLGTLKAPRPRPERKGGVPVKAFRGEHTPS